MSVPEPLEVTTGVIWVCAECGHLRASEDHKCCSVPLQVLVMMPNHDDLLLGIHNFPAYSNYNDVTGKAN